MRDFVITTESNSDMPAAFLEENQVCVIPHYYSVDEEVYGDGKELSIKEFYDAMRDRKKVATMASNPAVILDKFTEIAKSGKDILHISFSSALSGGCGNIMSGANEVMEQFPETKINVVDTLSVSLAEGILIKAAIDMRAQGKSLEETTQYVQSLVPHLCVQFTVDDLNHLYRGGRLSRTTAIVGTLANIKPILYVDDAGKLVALDKTRGRKKSLNLLVKNMADRLGSFKDKQVFIGIVHGDCEEDANYLAELVKKEFGYDNILIQPVGPSIGAHSGPGAIGLLFLGDHR